MTDERLELLNDIIPAQYFDRESGIMLYQGDCIEILEILQGAGNLIGLLLSDPPYGIAYTSNHRTSTDKLGKEIHNDEDLTIVEKVLPLVDNMLKDDSALYFFGSHHKIGEFRNLLDKFWTYKNTLIWDKGDAGTFGDLKAGYSVNYEVVFYYNKGRRVLEGKRPRTILRHDPAQLENRTISDISSDEFLGVINELVKHIPEDIVESALVNIPQDIMGKALYDIPKALIRCDWSSRNDPVHPTVKPVSLLKLLIKRSSNEGDIVLDPFCGSGTTGAAAKLTGRKFIGIELDAGYFRVAQDRIANTKRA